VGSGRGERADFVARIGGYDLRCGGRFAPRSLVYLPMRTAPAVPDVGGEGELPLDLVLAPRELRTASVPERDLPDLDADSIVPDDPKEADKFVLGHHSIARGVLPRNGQDDEGRQPPQMLHPHTTR
jgi:hypothetical protein